MPPAQPIVAAMEPIDLAAMDGVALLDRIDTKYVLPADSLGGMLASVADQYRVLEVEKTRWSAYRTLYYDTPQCDCYRQHHNGKLNRFKCRIREYASTGLCFLEVKIKTNKGRTDKRRCRIDRIEERLSAPQEAFVRSQIGGHVSLLPQLWSRFQRLTLVRRGVAERVTIDVDLQFECQEKSGLLPGLAIVELKQDRANRDSPIGQTLRRERIRTLRVSKYCLGSLLLKPQLKANRFKARLREIRKIA